MEVSHILIHRVQGTIFPEGDIFSTKWIPFVRAFTHRFVSEKSVTWYISKNNPRGYLPPPTRTSTYTFKKKWINIATHWSWFSHSTFHFSSQSTCNEMKKNSKNRENTGTWGQFRINMTNCGKSRRINTPTKVIQTLASALESPGRRRRRVWTEESSYAFAIS